MAAGQAKAKTIYLKKTMVITMIGSLLAATLVFIGFDLQRAYQTVQQEISDNLEIIEPSLKIAVATNAHYSAKELLASLGAYEPIQYAAVIKPDHSIFASHGKPLSLNTNFLFSRVLKRPLYFHDHLLGVLQLELKLAPLSQVLQYKLPALLALVVLCGVFLSLQFMVIKARRPIAKRKIRPKVLNEPRSIVMPMNSNLIHDLSKAIKKREFILHYQPRYDLGLDKIIATEALIRWQHPQFGLLYPTEFIPLAEQTDLINAIGKWVIEEACQQNKIWQQVGYADLQIAVNFSVKQLRANSLAGIIKRALTNTGLNPQSFEIELTETFLMLNDKPHLAILKQLKNLGVRLAIDDFGTGYSSLSYLSTFPIDNLKIDQSFIKGIASQHHSYTIVKAIIDMAHNLSLRVTAEGVEELAQLKILTAKGCDEVQGFLISKPLPVAQMTELLQANYKLNLQ